LVINQVKQVLFSHMSIGTCTFITCYHLRSYFVNFGLVDVGGVCAAGERLNVSQRFQPAGRFSLANSP
jgi:hypothetical protein